MEPIVGDRVEVDWELGDDDDDDDDDEEDEFSNNGCYKGVVQRRMPCRPGRMSFRFEIAYDDGEIKVEDLNDRRWRFDCPNITTTNGAVQARGRGGSGRGSGRQQSFGPFSGEWLEAGQLREIVRDRADTQFQLSCLGGIGGVGGAGSSSTSNLTNGTRHAATGGSGGGSMSASGNNPSGSASTSNKRSRRIGTTAATSTAATGSASATATIATAQNNAKTKANADTHTQAQTSAGKKTAPKRAAAAASKPAAAAAKSADRPNDSVVGTTNSGNVNGGGIRKGTTAIKNSSRPGAAVVWDVDGDKSADDAKEKEVIKNRTSKDVV